MADSAEGGNEVSVLMGNGDGTFQAPLTYATQGSPKFLALADLTGDGLPDIVVTNGNNAPETFNTISVLLNNGNGTFQNQVTYAVGATPQPVQVADLNGDGIPDLIVGNWGSTSDSVGVLLGNGNGTFQNQITFAVGNSPHGVQVADLTGDGRPDLVTANEYGNNVSELLSNNGSFAGQVYNVEPTPVVTSINRTQSNPDTAATSVSYTVTFNENVSNVAASDFQVTTDQDLSASPTVQVTPVSGSVYTVTVNGIHGAGNLQLSLIDNDSIVDGLGTPLGGPGNFNGSFQGQSYTVDQPFPHVVSIIGTNPGGLSSTGGSVSYTVTFSEAVTE